MSGVPNREIARDGLAALFTTELVGVGKPAQAVYNYKAADFDRQTPVVLVTSAGSDRTSQRPTWIPQNVLFLDLHLFALYAVVDEEGVVSYSEAQSEDALDGLEKAAIDVLLANSDKRNDPSALWERLWPLEQTEIDEVEVAGDWYRWESIPVAVEAVAAQS